MEEEFRFRMNDLPEARERLDRLQGKILAFVSDFESKGYNNLEVARALSHAAFVSAARHDDLDYAPWFYGWVFEKTTGLLEGLSGLLRSLAKAYETNKIN